jgi:hypothetical protein
MTGHCQRFIGPSKQTERPGWETQMSQEHMIVLNNGVEIPQIGVAVLLVPPDDAQRVVETAHLS